MKKILVIFVCVLMIATVYGTSFSALAEKGGGGKKPPAEEENIADGVETQITDEEEDQFYPAIFDDKIVWTDLRREITSYVWIYFYSILGESETPIASSGSIYTQSAIYENKIVYNRRWELPENRNIFMYDLDDDKEYQITTDPANDLEPDIYGNYIVFRRSALDQKSEIFIYDLSVDTDEDDLPNYLDDNRPDPDPAEIQLTDEEDPLSINPKIFGNIVVWEEIVRVPFGKKSSRTEYDVVIYHLGPDGVFGTGDDIKYKYRMPDDQRYPAIYGDIIVWEDNRHRKSYMNTNNRDIYMYYLGGDGIPGTDDDDEYQITKDKNFQRYPDIYDNLIVYTDDRNDNWDIYMYDLGLDRTPDTEDDGGEYRVTTNEANQVSPVIYGNNIVYDDDRNGNDDIYMFTLSEET